MKRIFIFLLAIMLFPVLTVPVGAQSSYSELERGLALTEAQRAQIQGIRDKYYPTWQDTRRETIRRRLELQDLGRRPAENAWRMERIRGEIRELEVVRENTFNQYRADVSRTLNYRQREEFNRFCDAERRRMTGPLRLRRHGR